MGKYIPGSPNLIVQNVPGGGSLRLANQMFNVAPRDGTLFGLASNGMPTTPLLSPEAAHFDPTRFYLHRQHQPRDRGDGGVARGAGARNSTTSSPRR